MTLTIKNSHYGPKIVTDNLVLALDAANPKSYPGSGTIWTDLSGRGNNGSLTNGPTYSSANGGSIVFDGLDDYVDLGSQSASSDLNMSSPSGGGICVDWWGYYNGTGDSFQRIIDKSNGGLAFNGWAIYTGAVGSTTQIRFATTGEVVFATSTSDMVANIWQNWCFTWNQSSGNWSWYLNGNETNSGNATWNIPSTTTGMRIGTWNHSTAREYNGKLSNMKIYTKSLTAAEVQQNYNATKSRFGL